MNEEKNMEIMPYSFSNLPAAADFNEILSDYAGMEFKLDKIKFPAAGVTVFEVPNSDGELETVKEFSGVILYQHQVNGYYQEAYTGGNNPPDCSSFDGNTGIGTPGGDCKTCPFNQYGSGQNQGKACKNRRWIYILRENEVLPVMLSIPPASLGAFKMNAATTKPVVTTPGTHVTVSEKPSTATDEYKAAFWNNIRNRNWIDVRNDLQVGTDSEGGFLVPDEFEKKLISALEEENVFRPLATRIQTSNGDRKIPVITQKGEAAWLEEEESYSLSDDAFGQISLSAYKVGTAIKISEELLNDSVFDLPAYIAKEFARRIGTKEEEAFLIGDGKGKPTGIFNATGGAEIGATAGANITFDDVIELFYSLKSPYRKKAVWIMNEQTIKVLRKLKDSTGNYLWQPSVTVGQPDTILNRPYVTSVYAPALAANQKPIAFGDFSYYWIADRQGRSMKRLNELFAMNGQIGFLASQRVDGKLILPEAVKVLSIKKSS